MTKHLVATPAVEVTPGERTPSPSPTCPLCHTVETATSASAVAEGAYWRCTRCGQIWNGERAATAAAYLRSAA